MEELGYLTKYETLIESLPENDQQLIKNRVADDMLKIKIANMFVQKENEFEDTSVIEKRKFTCLESCYKDALTQGSSEGYSRAIIGLKSCSNKCEVPSKDLEIYLKNTNFLSFTKLRHCASGCYKDYQLGSAEINNCYFECFSRLERRYKGYWLRHRNQLMQRYFPDIQ